MRERVPQMITRFIQHMILPTLLLLIGSTSAAKRLSEPFIVDLECQASTELCNAFTTSIQETGQLLASYLYITTPIRVKATVAEICDGCGITGVAMPSSFYSCSMEGGEQMSYPQALVRQYSTADWSEYDIISAFSSRTDWIHPLLNTTTSQTRGGIDVQTTVTHELIHGLGLVSLWSRVMQGEDEWLLTPPYNLDTKRRLDKRWKSWLPLSSFDHLLYDTESKTALSAYSAIIRAHSFKRVKEQKLYRKLHRHSTIRQATDKLRKAVESPFGVLLVLSGSLVPTLPSPLFTDNTTQVLESYSRKGVFFIHTEDRYQPGTTLSHLHQIYSEYDGLLTPYSSGNHTISLDMIRILEAVGWARSEKDSLRSLVINQSTRILVPPLFLLVIAIMNI